jgi:oligopeptide/dipeptide ABC transporter ATP-binding protein
LALNPKFLVLDEPTSALDVSVQAQILNLLKDLQKKFRLTFLFISHDLSVIGHMSTRIAVMYLGEIVEAGIAEDIFKNPEHPYTQALFSAILEPQVDAKRKRIVLQGDIPSPAKPPRGCRFHTRCQFVGSSCKESEPKTVYIRKDHLVKCHLMTK